MSLSDKTRLEIANTCYANVSGRFATFTNEKNRGPNFTWEGFITHCEETADLWIDVAPCAFSGNKQEVYAEAAKMARDIAQQLVKQATT
jgi:hypothetical protein